MKIHKGDTVKIIAGKDRGKTGEVLRVYPVLEKVVVKGVNMATRHLKSKQQGTPGERVTKEAPIHVSNVAYFDADTKQATRVGYKIQGKEKVRVSKKSGKNL